MVVYLLNTVIIHALFTIANIIRTKWAFFYALRALIDLLVNVQWFKTKHIGGQMANWSADKIQQKNVDDLIPYDRNPNIHPDSQIDQLVNSVREWGWTVPILIDENDMVLAGHGRLFAAKRLSMESVPCIVAEGWSENQKKAYVIADNKLSESSQWDDSLYFEELKSLTESGFNIELAGFENIDLIDDSGFDFSDDNYEPKSDAEEFNQPIIQYVMIFDDKNQQDTWHNFLAHLKEAGGSDGTHSARVFKHLKSSGF